MNAKILSEYIINKCYMNGMPVSNLKLQKILYFLYLAYYDKYQKALFSDRFSAWKLGAVIVDIYLDYSKYIANPICEQYSVKMDLPNNEIKFLNGTIEKLNSLDIWNLINQSKQSEYWKKAFEKGRNSFIVLPPNYQCRKSYKSNHGVMKHNEKNHRCTCCFGNYRCFDRRNFSPRYYKIHN